MGCHYFLITGQVSPCRYNKLCQTVAKKNKKNAAIMLANLTPACLENLFFSRYYLMEHI